MPRYLNSNDNNISRAPIVCHRLWPHTMLNALDALQILSHFMTGAFLPHLKDEETESWRRN